MNLTLVAVVVGSLVLHEIAHAAVARHEGDDSPAIRRRMTLSPVAHIDPLGSLLIPLTAATLGIPPVGWAKAVAVEWPSLKRGWLSVLLVAAAGPVTHLLLALVLWAVGMDLAAQTNVGLAVVNLLPIKPLDGYRISGAALGLMRGATFPVASTGPAQRGEKADTTPLISTSRGHG